MKWVVKLFFLLIFFGISSFFQVFAFPAGHLPVDVSAAVGQYYISLSGSIAPYASIVLTTNGVVLRSTVADANGYFSFTQVLVKKGFNSYCLTAVDVKRLGQSEGCFTTPTITGSYSRQNIFLAPTIGLFRTQIQVGSNAVIWGYSMPGALVSIHSSDGKVYTATADTAGYYEVRPLISSEGTYDMYATAQFKNQQSVKPTNKVTLIALTFSQQINKNIGNWFTNLLTWIHNLPLGPLWIGLPILILIFILWRKLKAEPEGGNIKGKKKERLFFDRLLGPHKLHHAWMDGVGY